MDEVKSYRIPNLIIGGRVALAFVAIGLLSASSPVVAAAGIVLTVVVIAMDALDGILARKLDAVSDLGAVLDITADRIVEHIFWIYFAVAHQVGVWVPLVVMTRSFVVDTVRGMALAHGKTAFGESTMMRSPVTRFLTGSRFMRNLYGTAKVVAFVLLGVLVTLERAEAASGYTLSPSAAAGLDLATGISVVTAVVLCVARGVPVVLDSAGYVFATPDPAPEGGDA